MGIPIRAIAIIWVFLVLAFIVFTELWVHYYTMFELHASLRDTAAIIHKACHDHDIRYWIACGTLLGSFREGNIICHDDDIDLCILQEDLRRLMDVLPSYGLEITLFLDGLYKVTAKGKQGVIDIFVCHKTGPFYSYTGYGAMMWPSDKYEIHDDFSTMYTLGTYRVQHGHETSFEPLLLKGPSREHAQNYLRRTYGDTWNRPRISYVHCFTAIRHTFWYSFIVGLLLLVLVPFLLKL